jgi:SAM-dependent methyltransferase
MTILGPDDRQRLSAIAHATSTTWGPISEATLTAIVERIAGLGLDRTSCVLDLGCGPAELLRRVVAVTGARGVGIDSSPHALEEAHRRLAGHPEADRIELQLADVTAITPRAAFDLVLCIGPGWDHGGWEALTAWAVRHAAPGGSVLLAEGAWRAPPAAEDLDTVGLAVTDYVPTAAVPAAVRRGGADPVWHRVVDASEWDAYGRAYRAAMLAFLERSADDPLAPALRARAGPGWPVYERLHALLDYVIVLASRPDAAHDAVGCVP